jgi:predicted ArsR family transcriptional regulator
MLERLLNLLRDPRTHSLVDLASALDTSPEMVQAMLKDLERMGYVRQVTGCAQNCSGCPMNSSCTLAGPTRIWALVERHEP